MIEIKGTKAASENVNGAFGGPLEREKESKDPIQHF